MGGFGADQMGGMTAAAMGGFDATQMAALDPTAMAGFDATQMAALDARDRRFRRHANGSIGSNGNGRF